MSHNEQKYAVEVRLTTSSGDGVEAKANLVGRWEISSRRRAQIAEALRELADDLVDDE